MYVTDRMLAARFNVSRVTIWTWVRTDPDFPNPVKLSPGCSRWKESEILAWEAAKRAVVE